MPTPSIIVVGSSNTDMIIKLTRIPRPGETILGGQFITAPGGKGANQAVAAARAGAGTDATTSAAVTFIARVGSDMFGQQAIAAFRRDRINVSHILQDPAAPSGVALIFVAQDGQNSIAVAGGANARLSPADVRKAGRAFAGASVVIMQLETPLQTVQAAAQLAAKAGALTILNPAPAQPLPAKLLKLISILTPNESEAEILTGIKVTSPRAAVKAADKLLAQGVQTVILTMGSLGAFVASDKIHQLVPAFKVRPVDTTAAGDVFNGALAVALSQGRSPIDAVRFANAAAAISVTRMGAQPSAPTRREIDRFLRQNHPRGQ